MIDAIAMLAWILVLAVAAPAAVLVGEAVAALPRPRLLPGAAADPEAALIIPAHDEGRHLLATLDDAKAAAWPGLRILVVADNCTDDTAAHARAAGVDVLERHDPARRGKGYALQFAIDALKAAPPDCVLFVDADTRFDRDALRMLARRAAALGRPVQARYEMAAPATAGVKARVSQFAWILMNGMRMRGLYRLAGVTRFTGVGLAAPWAAIAETGFGGGAITEDHELTFALAERRCAPAFAPDILMRSALPDGEKAAATQRARWELGSLGVLVRRGIPGIAHGLARRNPQLLAVALDAIVPPLVLFALALGSATFAGLVAALAGRPGPLLAALLADAAFAGAVLIGWARFGRAVLRPRDIAGLAAYIAEKSRIYGAGGRASAKTWVRTDRSDRPDE